MKAYRLKPPTFEARQFNGSPNCLVNGFFAWLGEGAKVTHANSKEVRISVPYCAQEGSELRVGDWVVVSTQFGRTSRSVVSDEDFQRDFEVIE